MSTLEEIEAAIERLPLEELFSLTQWLKQRAEEEWDREFEEDVAAGRLNTAAEKALQEHRQGQSTPCPIHGE